MKKIIFLDVDGTLIDTKQEMANSSKEAIRKARENGHYVVICTGRIHSGIYPWLLDVGFDGIIASAGANVFWKGEELKSNYIPKDSLEKVYNVLKNNNATVVFQGRDGRFMTEEDAKIINEYFISRGMKGIISDFKTNINEKPFENNHIESAIYINCDIDIEQVQKEVGEDLRITGASFGSERIKNGEITLMNIHKATGMKVLIDHLGIDRNNVIAFGDGLNDVEMIEFAKVGVAMGNAVNQVKEVADIVTDHITENGVYNGFKKLNLI